MVAEVTGMTGELELLEALVFVLKHRIPPGVLRGITGPRRGEFRPGRVENLDAKIAATMLVEFLERNGWTITRKPGFGATPHRMS